MDDISIGDMGGSRIAQNGVVQVRDSAHAWFTTVSRHMPAKSEAAGHAVYEDLVMVHVQQPGDMQPVSRAFRPDDAKRWPDQWRAYQEGKAAPIDGTPLSILFPASPSMVKNLESVGIHTIEQLADVTDTGLGNIPMGLTLRDKAKAFLAARDGADGFNRLQAQLDREREEKNSMKLQMQEMQTQLATLAAQRESDPGNNVSVPVISPELIAAVLAAMPQAEPKRGPGRPPKAQE